MKLLVSIRNLVELEIVAESGVAVVDMKEPARGPLGQVPLEISSRTPAMLAGRSMASLAMGELLDYRNSPAELTAGFQFAKIGLSGIKVPGELRPRWREWAASLDVRCCPVVVAYADSDNSGSLPVPDLAEFAVEVFAKWFLVDTWSKNGRGLLDWLEMRDLERMVAQLAAAGVNTVLAGSLDETAIRRLADIPAAMLGVRGAICSAGNRSASVDLNRLRHILSVVDSLGERLRPAAPLVK